MGAKLLDLRTNVLGDIFSQMSVWILIGTALAVYSVSPKQAAINVFLYCAGMLITYYLTAALTGILGVPGVVLIILYNLFFGK